MSKPCMILSGSCVYGVQLAIDKALDPAHRDLTHVERLFLRDLLVTVNQAIATPTSKPGDLSEVIARIADHNEKEGRSAGLKINTATPAELRSRLGMGREQIEQLVKWRDRAPFSSLDDLLVLRGIGPKTLEKWMPHLNTADLG